MSTQPAVHIALTCLVWQARSGWAKLQETQENQVGYFSHMMIKLLAAQYFFCMVKSDEQIFYTYFQNFQGL